LSIVIPAREWPSASVRAVLDTNIAVAGLPWRGKSYEVFGLTLTGKVLCFASDTLLAELDRVLGYKSSPCASLATLTTISELLAEYRSFVEIVPAVTISPTMTTDPGRRSRARLCDRRQRRSHRVGRQNPCSISNLTRASTSPAPGVAFRRITPIE
jgi:hypothetical protein